MDLVKIEEADAVIEFGNARADSEPDRAISQTSDQEPSRIARQRVEAIQASGHALRRMESRFDIAGMILCFDLCDELFQILSILRSRTEDADAGVRLGLRVQKILRPAGA